MLLLALATSLNATYVSTRMGGLWSAASSWEASEIPPCFNASSVLVQGPMQYNEAECELLDLQVDKAELQVDGDSLSLLEQLLLSRGASLRLASSSSLDMASIAVEDHAAIAGDPSPGAQLPLLRAGAASVANSQRLTLRDVDVWVDVFSVQGELLLEGSVAFQGVLRPLPRGDVVVQGTLRISTGALNVVGGLAKGGGELQIKGEASQIVVSVPGILKDFRLVGDVSYASNELLLEAPISILGSVRFQALQIESKVKGNAVTVVKGAFLAFDNNCDLILGPDTTVYADNASIFINSKLVIGGGTLHIHQSSVTITPRCSILILAGATMFLDHNTDYLTDSTAALAISGTLVIHHEGVLSLAPSLTFEDGGARLIVGPGVPTLTLSGQVTLYAVAPSKSVVSAPTALISMDNLQLLGGEIYARETSVTDLSLQLSVNEIHSDLEVLASLNLLKVTPSALLLLNGSLTVTGSLMILKPTPQAYIQASQACILGPNSMLNITEAPSDRSQDYLILACSHVLGSFRDRFVPVDWEVVKTDEGLALRYAVGSTPSHTTPPVKPTKKPGLTREETLIIAVCVALGLLVLALITIVAICCKLRRMRERGRYLPFDQGFNSEEDTDPQSMDNHSFSPHLLNTSDDSILFE